MSLGLIKAHSISGLRFQLPSSDRFKHIGSIDSFLQPGENHNQNRKPIQKLPLPLKISSSSSFSFF